MLVLDNAHISADRKRLMDAAIISTTSEDQAQRAWSAAGHKRDLLLVEVKTCDGLLMLMGRVRHHVDKKVMGSDDRKEAVCVVAPAAISPARWETTIKSVVSAAILRTGASTAHCLDVRKSPPPYDVWLTMLQTWIVELGADVSHAFIDAPKGSQGPG